MSAIGGIINFDGTPATSSDLARMQRELTPSGPDAQSARSQENAGLFHTLLRVCPEDSLEAQPLAFGPYTLVADLRLDNRLDIVRELGSAEALQTAPDSRLLQLSFEKWGYECPRRLVGAFAFAVWNRQKQELFLARDPRGSRTLFFTRQKDRFAFASLPTALLTLPGVPRDLSPDKLARFLVLDHRDHATTHFKAIERLPPATTLLVRQSGRQSHTYWKLDPQRRLPAAKSSDYLEQAREILQTCIRAALRSSTPIGSFLSGGLDSSTVTAIAAKELAERNQSLATYTEAPPIGYVFTGPSHRYADESPYALELAACFPNVAPHIVRTKRLEFLPNNLSRHAHLCSPNRNPLNVLWMQEIHRLASAQGIRVLLSGQSGNATLSYDGLHQLTAWARQGRLLQAILASHRLAPHCRQSFQSLVRGKIVRPLLPDAIVQFIARRKTRNHSSWRSYSALRHNSHLVGSRSTAELYSNYDSHSYRANLLSGFDYIGELSQKFAREAQIDVRDPLGDIRFVEFCFALPELEFLGPNRSRWLARRIGQGHLPLSILENSKMGLQFANWHQQLCRSKPRIEQELILLRQSPLASDLLDLDRLENLATQWPSEDWNSPAVSTRYRYLFARALETGNFIRWAEAL